MTRIAIVASGTRGDVQPYVALGQGLKQRGYSVRVLTSANFAPFVTEAGLEFHSIGASVEERLQSAEWRKTLESNNFLKIMAQMQREMKREAAASVERIPELLTGSDLIVTGMAGLAGVFSIAERLKIPVIQAHVFPFTPTSEFPSPLVTKLPFGRTLNRLSFHGMRQIFWQNFKVSDAITRQALGLKKAPFWGPYRSLASRDVPVLYGYSQHVLPRPSDWPASHHVTGYWFLDTPPDWTPPADLVDFLDAGEPPIYIGFGSMGGRNPEATGAIALEALARSGQRGVLATGWGGLQAADLPESVHMVAAIPHTWLFKHMAAIVHHGGAGTTAAGLRAGVPSIIAPFMGDQPFWGKRVADLGVGTRPIPQKKLTAKQLTEAILEAVTHKTMRQAAHRLGQQIEAESGIGNAVAIIERFCSGGSIRATKP
ncbi:MAG: glycosyltransferase family 1 protein [Herpetosiphonaceae bacterium]|nr:glycosyltransferase family 1 protein [Herpetosiphonaceae bacterium]